MDSIMTDNSKKVTKNEPMEVDTKTETKGKKGETKLALKTACEFDQLCNKEEYKQLLFMTSIKAPYFRPENRAPIDLICVVDESGSMSGEPISLVKTTVEFIIKNLESHDRFGCVGYADSPRCVLSLTKMDTKGKDNALKAVSGIKATGNTALCGGLLLGLNMMRERKTCNVVSSVMLFTDGQANVGFSTAKDIIRATIDNAFAKKDSSGSDSNSNSNNNNNNNSALSYGNSDFRNVNVQQMLFQKQGMMQQLSMLQQMPFQKQMPFDQQPQIAFQKQIQPGALLSIGEGNLAVDEKEKEIITPTPQTKEKEKEKEEGSKSELGLPCTINTFGFAAGHNESLLQAIAVHGRGMYAFIKSKDMISDTFAECLGGLVSVVAQEITLRLETLNGVKINQCLSKDMTMRVLRPGQCYEISFPDIQSEETRDTVFQLSVPSIKEPKLDWPLAQCVCSYKNAILGGKGEQVSTMASVARVESKETGERNHDLDLQNNRIVAADAMVDADTLANAGKLEEARARLNNAQEKIKMSRTNQDKYSTGLIQDIQQCSSGLKNESEYRNRGGKELQMNYRSHCQQRSVQSTAFVSQQCYTNNSKDMMKNNFKSG